MAHGRIGDMLYLHGSAAAGLFRDATAGSPVCVTATLLDGLVLGRSARNHSMNYRSVTIHGNAVPVTAPQEILDGLRAIVNHIIAGRWDQVRKPTNAEIRETGLWRVPIAEASVKTRTGSTLDPNSDRAIPVWAGVIPARITFGTPVAAEGVPPGIRAPTPTAPSARAGGFPGDDLRVVRSSSWCRCRDRRDTGMGGNDDALRTADALPGARRW
jgi:uncharacterized protein